LNKYFYKVKNGFRSKNAQNEGNFFDSKIFYLFLCSPFGFTIYLYVTIIPKMCYEIDGRKIRRYRKTRGSKIANFCHTKKNFFHSKKLGFFEQFKISKVAITF
jgi:hypothetical protein